MSIRNVFFIALIGMVVGVLGSFLYQKRSSRDLASELPPPKLRLKPWADSLSAKAHEAMTVQVTAIHGVPQNDDQELTLRAEVILNRPVDQEVKFQWTLPSGASVVSGEIEDAWPNLQPGQTATTEIVVTGVSKESVAKTVTLHVSGLSNGVTLGSSGSFATNSPEHIAAETATGIINAPNSKLVLKKSEAAAKMDKVHQ